MVREALKVRGDPTKELFVHILTRDIAHHAAIIELLDNSVDGAKRVAKDTDDLSDYEIDINFDKNSFSIADNCGGISLDVAKNYAFRFGRAQKSTRPSGPIGQFGVGMKRALFSFGRCYVVESATEDDWFRLEVDLQDWIANDDWDFRLEEYGRNDGTKQVGTRIEVTNLNRDAARQFALDIFRIRVENEIKQKHRFFIAEGLVVRVCGTTIPSQEWQLFSDEDFKPAFHEETYKTEDGGSIRTQMYAGVSHSSPSDAGWYVICNGRLILNAEKSEKTGWGWISWDKGSSGGIPNYHGQYARFRGYVLFDSDDPGSLPWNTTKTDVDSDNPVWLDARDVMASLMRPVIDFLNLVDSETELPTTQRALTSALRSAHPTPIAEVRDIQKFSYPRKSSVPKRPMVSIQFRKEKDKVDELQDIMNTSSARDTGEAAFDEAYEKYVTEQG